jgi:hypothetical protein
MVLPVRPEEIRRQAQVCFDRSARAPNAQSRSVWLAMAQLWLDKARRVEQQATQDALAEILEPMRADSYNRETSRRS